MGFFKKIFKPVSKVLDKVIPNEIKPALPYLAAFAPYFGPTSAMMGKGIMQRALISGGLNIGSQLAQEGNEGDINVISAGLGALQGAMTAPGAADTFASMTTKGSLDPAMGSSAQGDILAKRSMLTKAKDFGLGALEKGSGFIEEGLASGKLMDKAAVYSVPAAQATGDLMLAEGKRAQDAYEDALAAYEAEMGDGATDAGRALAIRTAMQAYGFLDEEIEDTIAAAGYRAGGRVGFDSGGNWITKKPKNWITKKDDDDDDDDDNEGIKWITKKDSSGSNKWIQKKANGGRIGYKDGTLEPINIGIGTFNPERAKELYEDVKSIPGKISSISLEDIKETGSGLGEGISSFYEAVKNPGKTMSESKLGEEARMYLAYSELSKDQKKEMQEMGLGLFDVYEYLSLKDSVDVFKAGGRVGLRFGGIDSAVQNIENQDVKESAEFASATSNMDIPMMEIVEQFELKFKRKPNSLDELKQFYKDKYGSQNIQEKITETVRTTAAEGGLMNLGGKEMDMRGGGFIPIGKKERADDVPARLSKNEFVMTADAVRAAGGGSVNKGAKRMYETMNKLEARA